MAQPTTFFERCPQCSHLCSGMSATTIRCPWHGPISSPTECGVCGGAWPCRCAERLEKLAAEYTGDRMSSIW